jgi:DNA-binding response OmpR family regulator
MTDDRGPILLVDDDAEILVTAARYLRARGLKVITSQSALGVSAIVRREIPSAIVLDVNMPALDGNALARVLNLHGLARTTPIIFYSAVDEEKLRALASEIPGASCVPKIEGPAALYEAIRCLETTRGGNEIARAANTPE